jgi:hypothetical protein
MGMGSGSTPVSPVLPRADDSRTAIKTLRALIDEQDERNIQIRLQLDDLERVMETTPARSDVTPDRSG